MIFEPSLGTGNALHYVRIQDPYWHLGESIVPALSTCTEWSITRSTGISGLILSGSPPSAAKALRKEAKSTTTGTPVKSCRITREGLNGTSISCCSLVPHLARFATCSFVITLPSTWRRTASSNTLMEYGRRDTWPSPAFQ